MAVAGSPSGASTPSWTCGPIPPVSFGVKPVSPCVERSDHPDAWSSRACSGWWKTREAWQEASPRWSRTSAQRYPGVKRIDLLTMLRGPGNRTCGSEMTVVAPYVDEAVATVAAKFPGLVVAAPKVEVQSCDVFTKGGPHFTTREWPRSRGSIGSGSRPAERLFALRDRAGAPWEAPPLDLEVADSTNPLGLCRRVPASG